MEGDLSFNRISMDSMLRIQRRGKKGSMQNIMLYWTE